MNVREAYTATRKAAQQLAEVMAKEYPVGSTVYWMRSGYQQKGIVLKTTSVMGDFVCDRLYIRNSRTEVEYCIYPNDLCDIR